MQKLTFCLPGVREQFEACREMASDASVRRTYFVTSPYSGTGDDVHVSRSLPTAFELWRCAAGRRLSVVFDWSVGDEAGQGAVTYEGKNDPTVQHRFVEQTVEKMIVREIADRLFEQIPRPEFEPIASTMFVETDLKQY